MTTGFRRRVASGIVMAGCILAATPAFSVSQSDIWRLRSRVNELEEQILKANAEIYILKQLTLRFTTECRDGICSFKGATVFPTEESCRQSTNEQKTASADLVTTHQCVPVNQ
jgi:hypothetical protein